MKTLLAFLFSLAAAVAQAHPSLVPHQHPHGLSILPDLDSLVVGAIVLFALALIAYAQFGRR